jgi:uncharacterized damage-inducible protein DinB
MINMHDIIGRMTAHAQALRALVQDVSPEQADWRPSPEAWSLREVLGHVYNEERMDFRAHLQEMLQHPPQPWGALHQEYVHVATCRQALDAFLLEREASLAWLKALPSPDWDLKSQASFGPSHETMTLSAGDILCSWVEHDILHLRQVVELLHAWNVPQASPYAVEYAGGW